MSKIKMIFFGVMFILGIATAWYYIKSKKTAVVTHEQVTTPVLQSPAARVDSEDSTSPPIGGTFEKKDTPKPAKKADTPATSPAVAAATATTAKVEKKAVVSSGFSKLFAPNLKMDGVKKNNVPL